VKALNFSDIKKIPWVENCPKTTFSDENFNLPKSEWIFDKFYPWFHEELTRYGVSEWNKKFDCDDFAAFFRILAQICHKKSKGSTDGLAVGEIHYDQENTGPHAINVVLTEKGPIFIEPQTGEQLILTKNEQNSIYRVRF
jgi:hypothetical protein